MSTRSICLVSVRQSIPTAMSGSLGVAGGRTASLPVGYEIRLLTPLFPRRCSVATIGMQGYGGVQVRKDAFDKWWKALGPLLATAHLGTHCLKHTCVQTHSLMQEHTRFTPLVDSRRPCWKQSMATSTLWVHSVFSGLAAFHRARIDQLIGWAFNDLLPRRLASATASKREMLQSLVIMGIRGTCMQLSLRAQAEELQGPRRVVVVTLMPGYRCQCGRSGEPQ